MALIDDVTKEVIDSNKAKRYEHNTKEMFKAWIDNCPVKLVDTTDQRPGYENIRTFQAWITVRK
jgi:hypothetical protein